MQHEERKVIPYLNHDLLSFFECSVCICMYVPLTSFETGQ